MKDHVATAPPDTGRRPMPNAAALRLRAGRARLQAEAEFTTGGLLALGALIAATLLSTAAIVAVATRKLPPGAMPAGMNRSRW